MIILGGSDKLPGQLPPSGEGKRLLSGCKGIDLTIGGRYLIDVLAERLRESGLFDPIYVAGPKAAYSKASTDLRLIDTDEGFGRNIQAGLEAVIEEHPATDIGMATCDILPEPGELATVLDDYLESRPCDLWFPIVATPRDEAALGESAWKPRYHVRRSDDADPVPVLPGHLTIFDPRGMRLRFLYRLLDRAYQSRNRPIGYRRSFLLRQMVWGLLLQDLRHLATLRPPTLCWECVRYGVATGRRLKAGVVSRFELEDTLRRIFVKRRYRKKHPERRILMPIVEAMSLARDIDTFEEAAALGSLPLSEGTA